MCPSPTSATRCLKPVRATLLAPERPRFLVNYRDLAPAQLLGVHREVVLTPSAFVVMTHLTDG